MYKIVSVMIIAGALICLGTWYGCDNGTKNTSAAILKAEKVATVSSKKVSNETDTFQFKKFDELARYYSLKLDSIDRIRVTARSKNTQGKTLDKNSIVELDEHYHSLIKERNISIQKFIQTNGYNKETFNGLRYLVIDWTFPLDKMNSLFHMFPRALQTSIDGKWIFNRIEKRKSVEKGGRYNRDIVKFEFHDTSGKTMTLEGIHSRYILLDFWASWCGPCRYENRWLVNQKDLLNKGNEIAIVAISLDTDRNKWTKASREDKLNYLNICDFKGMDSKIAQAFKISTIPFNVLLSSDGTIIGYNLWSDDLLKVVKMLP